MKDMFKLVHSHIWSFVELCITNRPSETILTKIKTIIKTNNFTYQNRLVFMNQPSNINRIKYSQIVVLVYLSLLDTFIPNFAIKSMSIPIKSQICCH